MVQESLVQFEGCSHWESGGIGRGCYVEDREVGTGVQATGM